MFGKPERAARIVRSATVAAPVLAAGALGQVSVISRGATASVHEQVQASTDGGASCRTAFPAECRPVDGGSEAHPEWSPDGVSLAFEAVRDGQADVYVAAVDGSSPRRLTSSPAMESYPRFSADGRQLAYLRREGSSFTSHRIDMRTGRELPMVPLEGALEPAFAPDGQRIAVRTYQGGADPDGEVAVVNLDDGTVRMLTDNDVEDGFPSFMDDGAGLLFHRRIGGRAQVMEMDLASGREAQLTEGDFDSWHAHAAPDGTSIVFDSERYGQRDIFLMDRGTGAVRRLTTDPDRDGYPKLSPDGTRVAFHSDREGRRGIHILDLRTGAVVAFTPRWTASIGSN